MFDCVENKGKNQEVNFHKKKQNEIMMETKCKKYGHGTTSSLVIKKSVSHHPPTYQPSLPS
jgi:hypothetical protein